MANGLATWVKERRMALGMPKQADLAERMGLDVDVGYVQQVESGRIKVPGPDYLPLLAKALGVDQVDLLVIAGVLRRDAEDSREAVDPDEYRVQRIMGLLPNEDRDLIVGFAELLLTRHEERMGR